MRAILMSVIIISLTAFGSHAAENNANFRSFLSGTSCGQFINGIAQKKQQKEFIVMIGSFITGSNFAKGRDSKIDLKGMTLLTEQFCRQNPKKPVTAALIFLDNAIDRRNAVEAKGQSTN